MQHENKGGDPRFSDILRRALIQAIKDDSRVGDASDEEILRWIANVNKLTIADDKAVARGERIGAKLQAVLLFISAGLGGLMGYSFAPVPADAQALVEHYEAREAKIIAEWQDFAQGAIEAHALEPEIPPSETERFCSKLYDVQAHLLYKDPHNETGLLDISERLEIDSQCGKAWQVETPLPNRPEFESYKRRFEALSRKAKEVK